MSENHQPTLLVTGATGHLGRRVLDLLIASYTGPIIAATRNPENLAAFSQQGVTIRRADFDDPASLATAFEGADRLLLISTDALDKPGHRLAQHVAAVKAAAAAGVSHVVYTSLINPDPDSPVLLAPDHLGTEAALANTKMTWTILRNNIYADSQLQGLAQALQMGKLFSATGAGKAAYVTREDCAQAAAAALMSPFSGRRILDITGPEALSSADLAAMTAQITGQPLAYIPLSADVFTANLLAAGLPHPIVDLIISFDVAIAQGQFSNVPNTVEELTGRKPIAFRDFLAANQVQLAAATITH
jgi:NAD(P)H dehydrogenase (quinone)